MTERNVTTEWARLLMASFADAGVTDIVLSPGSRSTPYMLAAARTSRLRCHDAIDERAAAFFALGHARRTGRPAVLLCTSGSAAAHYFPAIVEASTSFVPLIALTADRPHELQDCGAPQAIDQIKLYGGYVRHFFDLGDPSAVPNALRGVRRVAAQAVHHAEWPIPGPVHINARARKPLEPFAPETDDERRLHAFVDELLARPVTKPIRPATGIDPSALESTARAVAGAKRGILVCGPMKPEDARARGAIFALAKETGFPVYAEATSQVRFAPTDPGIRRCDALGSLLGSPLFAKAVKPDLILQLGGTLTAGPLERLASEIRGTRIVVHPHGWHDPQATASEIVFGPPHDVAAALAKLVHDLPKNDERAAWGDRIVAANEIAWKAIDEELARPGQDLTEGAVVRELVERIPAGSLLLVGNSLPIRELDVFCRQGATDVSVLCQRGANGIDGLIAGAAGAARAGDGPTTLLLGDVSFLHDVSSLMIAAQHRAPLVILVVQNFGGRIFESLPLAKVPGIEDSTMAHVTTPHRFDFAHAASSFGVAHVRVTTREALAQALANAYQTAGSTVVEAIVPEHGASAQNASVARAIDRALAAASWTCDG